MSARGRFVLSVLLAVCAFGALAACSGASEDSLGDESAAAPAPAEPSSPEPAAPATGEMEGANAESQGDVGQIQAVVPQLSDFEPGWRADSAERDTPCLDAALAKAPPHARTPSDKFVMGESSQVTGIGLAFASKVDANAAWERLVSSAYNQCILDETAKNVNKTEGVTLSNSSVGGLSVRRFGDRTSAAQFVIEAESSGVTVNGYQDLIWIQAGSLITGLAFAESFSPLLQFTEEAILEKVAKRMTSSAS